MEIRGRDVEATSHIKYLGVYIDQTVNWKKEITFITSLKSVRDLELFQTFISIRNLEDPTHEHHRTPFQILLLSLGVLWES